RKYYGDNDGSSRKCRRPDGRRRGSHARPWRHRRRDRHGPHGRQVPRGRVAPAGARPDAAGQDVPAGRPDRRDSDHRRRDGDVPDVRRSVLGEDRCGRRRPLSNAVEGFTVTINATLIAQMIVFLILIWVTMKYIWPVLMTAMDERAKRISEGLS